MIAKKTRQIVEHFAVLRRNADDIVDLRVFAQRVHDRRHLDRVGTRPEDAHDLDPLHRPALRSVAENVRELAGKGERERTEHEADRIDQQYGLTHVQPKAEDQLVVKVSAIRLGDALAAARPPHDRGGRIEHRQREHEQRDDDADRNRGLAGTDD